MTPREIIKTLLNKEIPERVGLFENFWGYIVENAWGAQGLPADTNFEKRFNLDIGGVAGSWTALPGPRPDLAGVVEESDEWTITCDAWGSTQKNWKHRSGTPEHVGFAMDSPEVWKRDFREAVVALKAADWTNVEALKKAYKEAMAGDLFVPYAGVFIFEDMRRIMGDVTMLEAILLEPEWIRDFCTVFTDKYIERYELLFREVGRPDGMFMFEDLGYTAAPFISPACHREMVLPHHKRLFGFFKDYNLPIIMHTCGDFRPHIPAIIEAGVDCIQTLEAKTGMNVVTLAEQYKDKLCFMGNIDIMVLESGDRARIKEECLSKLNGMKALRAPYVYMSDHSISPAVKLADYEYMLDLFWANCHY